MSSITENAKYGKVFEEFGVVLGGPNASGEAIADECPWCGKDKFYVNLTTGQYHCKHCEDGRGNLTTFLTATHAGYLERTSDAHYHALRDKRGIALQTLKRHGLAFDPHQNRWLVPFKSREGNVVNIQFYYPDGITVAGKIITKRNLAGLSSALYGLDRLSTSKDKIVFLCEGPFDAIALDYHLGTKRDKYDVIAIPTAFKEEWAGHFKGRKVRALFDNDKGGQQHGERVRKLLGESNVAAELLILKWPEEYPEGCDINDLVRDPKYAGVSIVGLSKEHGVKVVREPKLRIGHGRRAKMEEKPIDWLWPDHLRCGTYTSFSGKQGTFKSTIALELAARYTAGRKMPTCDRVGLPAGHVLYIHAEDDREAVENSFEWAGGDFSRWHPMPALTRDDEAVNILEHLAEMEEIIKQFGIRLVIIDGQNSVVGAPNISTDMLARNNVTNKFHQWAQKLNLCLIGIRNEDAEGRALGPQSFGDIGRCVVRAVETEPTGSVPYCLLKFVKVSDTARINYPAIPYSVRDRGGSRREIVWGKERPKTREQQAVDNLATNKANGTRVGEKPPPKNHP